MTIAVLANETQKEEISEHKFPDDVQIVWADSLRSLSIIEADAYFDLIFEADRERVLHLKRLLPAPIFVNSVINTCSDIGYTFIRLNAWPTMLCRTIAEVAAPVGYDISNVAAVLGNMGWKYLQVPDVTGMITPRIIATIINEAAFALGEGVSTKEQIDTAMKLGTNYPYGPFEWLDKIGRHRIVALLESLEQTDARYTIAPYFKTKS